MRRVKVLKPHFPLYRRPMIYRHQNLPSFLPVLVLLLLAALGAGAAIFSVIYFLWSLL